jgi:hypothetical protein
MVVTPHVFFPFFTAGKSNILRNRALYALTLYGCIATKQWWKKLLMHYTLFRLQVITSPTGRKEMKETEGFHTQ